MITVEEYGVVARAFRIAVVWRKEMTWLVVVVMAIMVQGLGRWRRGLM